MPAPELTDEDLARVAELFTKLGAIVAAAGIRVEALDVPEQGIYDRTHRRIILSTRVFEAYVPPILDALFTLAHEFGHHLSHEDHERRTGCAVNMDRADSVLYEESNAWKLARETLRFVCGMEEGRFWGAFQLAMSVALASYTHDFAASHRLEGLLVEKSIKCPGCRSAVVAVLGLESRRDMALACLECGTHSRPHRTADAVVRALRVKTSTFTNICSCALSKSITEDGGRVISEPAIPSMRLRAGGYR
jgi:hypothetical protein